MDIIIDRAKGKTQRGQIAVEPIWEFYDGIGSYGALITLGRRTRIYSPKHAGFLGDELFVKDLLPYWKECMTRERDSIDDVDMQEYLSRWTDLVNTNLTPLTEWFDNAIFLALSVARKEYQARNDEWAREEAELDKKYWEEQRRDEEIAKQYYMEMWEES